MKRETLRHPKTFDLASRLGVARPAALGFLTLLWDFTADSAIQGDIGKWTNGAIARACDWSDDPDLFVESLVEAGWIDRDPTHRLLIHDWSDHAERWVRAKLDRLHLKFTEPTTGDTKEPTTEATVEPSSPRDQSNPNQTEPNQSEPNPPAAASVPLSEQVEKIYRAYPRRVGKEAAVKAIRKALTTVPFEDLLEAVQAYSAARMGEDPQFTPYPSTWFNQGRWADDRSTWKARAGHRSNGGFFDGIYGPLEGDT